MLAFDSRLFGRNAIVWRCSFHDNVCASGIVVSLADIEHIAYGSRSFHGFHRMRCFFVVVDVVVLSVGRFGISVPLVFLGAFFGYKKVRSFRRLCQRCRRLQASTEH